MGKNIHTVPFGNKWANKEEGDKKPLSVHRTKAAADDKGASLAKKAKAEHIIHGRNGRIQDKDSYGKDPYPPKDKKH